jgi:hypothetical protein
VDKVNNIIKYITIKKVEKKISAYKQDYSTRNIDADKKILQLKTELELKNLGYSSNDSLNFRKNLEKNYLKKYEDIFHCSSEIKTKIKSELPQLYQRIMISRYTRLNEHLKSL